MSRAGLGIMVPAALAAFGLWLLLGSPRLDPVEPPPPGEGPTRIISLAPNLTEIIIAVGAGPRLVGRTSACDHPPEVLNGVPAVGGYGTPGLERVLRLQPDLVVAPEEGAFLQPFCDQLQAHGVPVASFGFLSLEEVVTAIRQLGRRLDAAAAANRLADQLTGRLERLARSHRGIRRPRVMLVVDRNYLIVAGDAGFLGDAIRAAGGRNAFASSRRYFSPTLPSIIMAAPEVIIDLTMVPGEDSSEAAAFWESWQGLPAVRTGRVAALDPDLLTRAGPRLIDGIEELAWVLHPDRLPQPSGPSGR